MIFAMNSDINVLVATDIDPVWHDPESWVWTPAESGCQPVDARRFLRRWIVICGGELDY